MSSILEIDRGWEEIIFRRKLFRVTLVFLFLSFAFSWSAPLALGSNGSSPTGGGGGDIENVPYTWQKIDGFCAYASLSSVFQYYGENMSLEKTLALSGAAWGAGRVKAGSNWLFLTGPLSMQMWDFDYLADSLGYELKLYYSEKGILPGSAQRFERIAKSLDLETQTLDNWPDAKALLESKLENETPIILSVDAYYLPHNQYLTLPRGTLLLPRHGVVAVGYSENDVEIMDPAIGVLGENYGRPSRSQATYHVGFSRLRKGWKNTGFTAFSLEKAGEGEDLTKSLVSRIRNKISPPDNITGIYPQVLSEQPAGYRAFAALGRDFAPENFLSLLKSWNTRFHENRTKLVETLQGARSSLVKALTSTKYSLSKGTKGLKKFSENYEKAVEELNRAVEEFGDISDNYRLLYPVKDKRSDNTSLDLAFDTLSEKLGENASLESAIESARPYLENLSRIFENISSHLRRSSEILKEPEEPEKRGGDIPWVLIGGSVAVIAIAISAFILYRKK